MMKTIVFVCLYIIAISSWAELGEQFIKKFWSPDNAATLIEAKVDKYYEGVDKTKNYYAEFRFQEVQSDKVLIFVTGMSDPIPLWFDTVLKARDAGYKYVYVIELRGQGQSEKVPDNVQRLIHVESFDDYYQDLVTALKAINKENILLKPTYIISHSTGSVVLGNALERVSKEIPNLKIRAMSYWSPLFRVNVGWYLNNPVVKPALSLITKGYRLCCGILTAKKYGRGKFETNKLTTDKNNYELSEEIRYTYALGSNGVSLRWAIEAINATEYFRENYLNKIKIPTLLVKAEKDKIVSNHYVYENDAIKEWTVPKAEHGLHIEVDNIFNEVTTKTFNFLSRY